MLRCYRVDEAKSSSEIADLSGFPTLNSVLIFFIPNSLAYSEVTSKICNIQYHRAVAENEKNATGLHQRTDHHGHRMG